MAVNDDNKSTTRLQIANTVIEGSFKVTVALIGFFTASVGIVVGLISLAEKLASTASSTPQSLPSPTPTVSLSPTPFPKSESANSHRINPYSPASSKLEPESPYRINSYSKEATGFALITNYCMSTGGSYTFCKCKTSEWRKRYSLDDLVWKLKNDPRIVWEGKELDRLCSR